MSKNKRAIAIYSRKSRFTGKGDDFFSYELNRVKLGRNKEALAQLQTMFGDLQDAFHEADRRSGGK